MKKIIHSSLYLGFFSLLLLLSACMPQQPKPIVYKATADQIREVILTTAPQAPLTLGGIWERVLETIEPFKLVYVTRRTGIVAFLSGQSSYSTTFSFVQAGAATYLTVSGVQDTQLSTHVMAQLDAKFERVTN